MPSFKFLKLNYQFKGVPYTEKLEDIYNMTQLVKVIFWHFSVDVAV